MKITITLTIVTLLFSTVLDDVQAQTETVGYAEEEIVSPASSVIQGGIGLGYMMSGIYFGMNGKYVSSYRWGASLDLKYGVSRTKNLPSDYTPLFYPMDERTIISLCLVKVITGHGQNPRFSVQAGPSLVIFNNSIITPNPDYDPNSIWHLSKYFKTMEVVRVPGLSISVETEVPLTSFMILDISVFGNLNKSKSLLGIGLNFDFGDVTD